MCDQKSRINNSFSYQINCLFQAFVLSAHVVKFNGWNETFGTMGINMQDVIDIIDILYDGPDTSFMIVERYETSDRRGSHRKGSFDGCEHEIALSHRVINDHFDRNLRIGGNFKCNDVMVGVLSVLAHEIGHANQHGMHKDTGDEMFWKGKYYTRPWEGAARQFADNNAGVVKMILGFENDVELLSERGKSRDEEVMEGTAMFEIADVLSESGFVTLKDIVEELKFAGINNASNVEEVSHYIEAAGGKIENH